MEHHSNDSQTYTCPMHPEVQSDKPGKCPKCGMDLVPSENKVEHENMHHEMKTGHENMDHSVMGHGDHVMKPMSQMSFWEKFKMSMTMAMGMEHNGLAGREMAALMERDIRNKFWFAFVFTLVIVAYSPMGRDMLGLHLWAPIPIGLLLFILTTPVFFYSGWGFFYFNYKEIQQKNL